VDIGYEMLFEYTIRSFLGEKAYHTAGQAHNEKSRREWYRKVFKKIAKRIDLIDTTPRHKEQIEYWCARLLKLTSQRRLDEQTFILCLLRLSGALLGYLSMRGSCLATLAYFQSPPQYYTQDILNGGDALQNFYDKESATGTRARIAAQLNTEGLNDFHISLVLNTTEYQVKRLRREL
jgi:hypothetical protein